MKGLADKGEREEKRRNEGQKGLGDMNPLTHITITRKVGLLRGVRFVVFREQYFRSNVRDVAPTRQRRRMHAVRRSSVEIALSSTSRRPRPLYTVPLATAAFTCSRRRGRRPLGVENYSVAFWRGGL